MAPHYKYGKRKRRRPWVDPETVEKPEEPEVFRLMDLPLVPITRILKKLSVIDLFDFSFCSKKCEEMVKSLQKQLSIELRFSHGVTFNFYENGQKVLTWHLNGDIVKKPIRVIGGVEMRFGKEGNEARSKVWQRYHNASTEAVINRFLELFNCKLHSIFAYTYLIPKNFLNIIEKFDGDCEKVELSGRSEISSDILDFMMCKLRIKKKLNICGEAKWGYQPKFPFSIDSDLVYISIPSNIITSEHFLNSDCVHLAFMNSNFKENEIFEKFIENWFNSTNTRLKSVKIGRLPCPDVPLQLERFGGCGGWDSTKRNRYFGLYGFEGNPTYLDVSHGIDIVRNDGLMATVFREHDIFRFLVWHDRFQVTPERFRIWQLGRWIA